MLNLNICALKMVLHLENSHEAFNLKIYHRFLCFIKSCDTEHHRIISYCVGGKLVKDAEFFKAIIIINTLFS